MFGRSSKVTAALVIVVAVAACGGGSADVASESVSDPSNGADAGGVPTEGDSGPEVNEPSRRPGAPSTTPDGDGPGSEPADPRLSPPDVRSGWTESELAGFTGPPGVAVTNAGYMVYEVNPPEDGQQVLASSDGLEWLPAPVTAGGVVTEIVGASGRFVAVGSWCDPNATECTAEPAAWTSDDGRTWGRSEDTGEVFVGCSSLGRVPSPLESFFELECTGGRPATLERIGSSSHGFVAVGLDLPWTVQWRSAEGSTWQATRFDEVAPDYPFPAAGDGWHYNNQSQPGTWSDIGLIQPGWRCVPKFEGDDFLGNDCWGFVFSSPDGVSWAHEADPDLFMETWFYAAISTEAGATVLGVKGCFEGCPSSGEHIQNEARVFTTTDGTTWTPGEFENADTVEQIREVVTTEFGFFALGVSGSGNGLWHSIDGATWTHLIHGPDVFGESSPEHLAGDGNRLAVGAGRWDDDPMYSVWTWSG